MFFLSPFGEGDAVSKKLESDHVRPVGSELRTRLRDRVGGTALTDLYATGTCISQSRSRLPLGRDRESAPERGDITDMSALRRDDKRAWLRLSTVCGPKEGRRHQTSCEPEGSQFSCPTGALQDGRHTPTEGHSTPRGLDDKGRSERRLFFNPSQQPRQEIPEISLARQDVPVQLPTVRTIVGPVDLYQGHKASGDYSQNTGHENNHLHRRHPGDGTKQGTGSGAHRVPDISVGEPWVHRQSTEIFDRPHTGYRIPGSRCRLRFDGAQITGFKYQEHPVRCQSAAPNGSAHGSGSVKTAGQVDPCNPLAMRAAPLFFRHLQACLQAALQPLQDYSQHCPLTKERKEDLNWWATHPTSRNGKSIIRGNPDLTIETDASNTGWGARRGSLQTGGPWSPTEARMHINCLELLAATLAIQAFAKKQENILVHLKMDSTFCPDVHQQDGRYSLPQSQSAHQGSLDLVPSPGTSPSGPITFQVLSTRRQTRNPGS